MTYEKDIDIGENSVSLAIMDTAGNVSMYILYGSIRTQSSPHTPPGYTLFVFTLVSWLVDWFV